MFCPLGDLPDPGIGILSLASLALQADSYCWAIRDFNFMLVVSFKCYLSSFFFLIMKNFWIFKIALSALNEIMVFPYVMWMWCTVACLLACLLRRCSHVLLCATPMGHSPPGSSVHRILEKRTMEWVAISFSNMVHDTNAFCNDDAFLHSRKNHTCVYCTILIIWIDINDYFYMHIYR